MFRLPAMLDIVAALPLHFFLSHYYGKGPEVYASRPVLSNRMAPGISFNPGDV